MLFFDNPRRKRRRSRRSRKNPYVLRRGLLVPTHSYRGGRKPQHTDPGGAKHEEARSSASGWSPFNYGLVRSRGKRKSTRRKGGIVARRKSSRRRRRRASGFSAGRVVHVPRSYGRRAVRLVRRRYGTRGRTVWAPNPGNIVAIIKTGVKDGAVILASQIATKKAIDLASRYVPVSGIAGAAITGLGVPVVIALVARKALPAYARLATAAAFAEGVRRIVAASPAGPFLSDVVNAVNQNEEYGAWPAPQVGPGMGAYPGGLNDYDEAYVQ